MKVVCSGVGVCTYGSSDYCLVTQEERICMHYRPHCKETLECKLYRCSRVGAEVKCVPVEEADNE